MRVRLGLGLSFNAIRAIASLFENRYYTNDSTTNAYFTDDAKANRYFTK